MNPQVLYGKPVIKGTTITVEALLRKLAAGMTPEEIVAAYPRLVCADIQAAEAFAADCLAGMEVELGVNKVRLVPAATLPQSLAPSGAEPVPEGSGRFNWDRLDWWLDRCFIGMFLAFFLMIIGIVILAVIAG